MHWDLWHVASANLVGDWETEDETRSVVRRWLGDNDSGLVNEIAAGQQPDGPTYEGAALLAWAFGLKEEA